MFESIVLLASGIILGHSLGRIVRSSRKAQEYQRGYQDATTVYKERMNTAYGKFAGRTAYGNYYPPGAADDASYGEVLPGQDTGNRIGELRPAITKAVDHSTALLPFISCGCPHCNALREEGK